VSSVVEKFCEAEGERQRARNEWGWKKGRTPGTTGASRAVRRSFVKTVREAPATTGSKASKGSKGSSQLTPGASDDYEPGQPRKPAMSVASIARHGGGGVGDLRAWCRREQTESLRHDLPYRADTRIDISHRRCDYYLAGDDRLERDRNLREPKNDWNRDTSPRQG
jgi:hypothetical protein